MLNNKVEFNILIKGRRAATEYVSPRDGQVYIEGRDGSEFDIEIVNRNAFRIEAVISVDGLSITDGKEASEDSTGYLVPAYGTIKIPGWKVDGAQAARFQFAGNKGGSYAEQTTGTSVNKGVIGVMVFEEKEKEVKTSGGLLRGMTLNNAQASLNRRSLSKGISSGYVPPAPNAAGWYDGSAVFMGSSAVSSTLSCSNATMQAQADMAAYAQSALASASATSAMTEPVPQTLGTAFGEATAFQTKTVDFERADMLVMFVVHYDDRRGLERRGIQIERPSRERYQTRPNPFPGSTGCVPPAGWKG